MDTKYRPQGSAAIGRAQQKLGSFRAVPALLARFGLDAADVLHATGLSIDDLASQTAVARSASVNYLLNVCAERTGCAHFGLLVGQSNSLDGLGDICALAKCAPDVGSALRGIAVYFKYHNGAALVWLEHRPDRAALHYCIYESREEPSTQLYAGVSATMCNVLGELIGPGWSPLEVHLPFRKPRDVWPYRNCLRAPLVFDAGTVAVHFDRRWLKHPLRTSQPETFRQLEERFRDMDAFGDIDFVSIVRRLVRRQLLVDTCDADDIATALAMHRRTLDRRLEASGTTFRALLDAVKFDVARQLLRETSLPVQQVAAHLRYSSVANFSTAFRRWAQESPRDFRSGSLQPPRAMVATTSTMPTPRKTRPVSRGRAIVSFAKR